MRSVVLKGSATTIGLDERRYAKWRITECEYCQKKTKVFKLGCRSNGLKETVEVCESCIPIIAQTVDYWWPKVDLNRSMGSHPEDEDLALLQFEDKREPLFEVWLDEFRGNLISAKGVRENRYQKRYVMGRPALERFVRNVLGRDWVGERELKGTIRRLNKWDNPVTIQVSTIERYQSFQSVSGVPLHWDPELQEYDIEPEDFER